MNILFAFLADYHDNVSFVDFILIPIVHIHISTYQRFQYILTYKMWNVDIEKNAFKCKKYVYEKRNRHNIKENACFIFQ